MTCMDCHCRLDILHAATRDVQAWRVSTGASAVRETCHLVVEEALTVAIEDVGSYNLMCTPHDVTALAVGFAFSEGIIAGVDEIKMLHRCEDEPGVIQMRLCDPGRTEIVERNLIVTSSCGMCGSRQGVEQVLSSMAPVGDSLRLSGELLQWAAQEMRDRQAIFSRTGGTHAAGVFSGDGELIAFGEDMGRHNALDKAIGMCLLARRPTQGCGAMLSGRVSFELVAKCVRAGIELIAAVSAPSSLAAKAAEHWNITLCGFVRGDRATVYTHGKRIADLDQDGGREGS